MRPPVRMLLAVVLAGLACRGDGAKSTPTPPEEHVCVAKTCGAAGAACGTIPDGCGGTVECGTCPEGQTCGGGGANQCGTAACTATTCEALGAHCGTASDGCGATLECGGCPAGQTCGGGGAANVCGAPAPPAETGGATRWVRDLGGAGDEYVAAVRVRHDGVVVALTAIGGAVNAPGGDKAVGLVWLSPGGEVLRSRTYPGLSIWPGDSMALSPAGDVFLELGPACSEAGCAKLGERAITEDVLVKLSPDGDLVWSVPWMGYGYLAADASGGVAAVSVPINPTVVRFDASGHRVWSAGGRSDAARTAVAFGPDGTAVIGQALRVLKVDAAGKRLWESVLSEKAVDDSFTGTEGAYAFLDVGVTADGTVLAAGTYVEPLTVGSDTLPLPDGHEGVFLAAFSGTDGKLKWAKGAGSAGPLGPPWGRNLVSLAIHGEGPIAMLVANDPCGLRVERWKADGTRAWTHAADVAACGDDGLFPWSLDVAPAGDVLVGGEFSVPVDFGTGTVKGKGGRDGFVMDLAP